MPIPTKILVVDDEPDLESLVRMQFRRHIRAGDYAFYFAADGEKALQVLEEQPDIEIMLTDLNMPHMDGLTLLNRLGAMNRSLKAIVVSAYGDMKNIRTAMNRGSFDFLVKPVDLDDLEITVNKARATIEQQRAAQRARTAFGRYLSDAVVAVLLDQPEALKLGGEKRNVTMLMSDLRGFSTISEQLPPERVVEILNLYLGHMTDIIDRYAGTIDEFIGDAIFVLFGAPLQRDDDAPRAVACALEMQQAMPTVNDELATLGGPNLNMGIGIHTGEVVVGNIGSDKRAKYGAVGSHVNLTSRIESYTIGGQILISDATRRAVGDVLQVGRRIEVATKGFAEPMSLFDVEGIGAPYHLSLHKEAVSFVMLKEPEHIHYVVLDGKHVRGEVADARLCALASTGAILEVDQPVELLDNLKLILLDPIEPGQVLGDMYAKVVELRGERDVVLRFTAVPEDIATALRHLKLS